MPVSRIDQSKGRWWDESEAKVEMPKKPPVKFLFRRIKEAEVCECGRKASWTGGVWSYGHQKGKLWEPIRRFCKICFDKEVRKPLLRYIQKLEDEGECVELRAYKGHELAKWLIVEPVDLDDLPDGGMGLVLPSGKILGEERIVETPKKTIHLFGQTVEVRGDYGGLALPKEKNHVRT